MAHRKSIEEATELKEKLEQEYPGAEIRITESGRWGYTIREVRKCEDCGGEVLTVAFGEIPTVGDLCKECRRKEYERNWQAINKRGQENRALVNEHIWRNNWEE